MYEDLNQKISQFLDKELDYNEALSLLKKIQAHPEAKNKLNRYEAISSAIKSEAFLTARPDFSERIRQEIQNEPTYLLPGRKMPPQHKQFKRHHKILAVAASLAVVAVITTRSINNPPDKIKSASIIEVAQQQLPEQPSEPVSYKNEAEPSPINSQINDYLQAHNSSVYTNGQANFQPYTRVTAYSRK